MNIFRIIAESFAFAAHSLVANRLRTALSLLGVVIGIFVIILIFTAVDSLKKNVNDSISSLGDDVVFVHKWPWEGGFNYPWWKYMLRPQPSLEETELLKKRTETAQYISFKVSSNRPVKYRNNNIENTEISGIWVDYEKVHEVNLSEGRFFTENELRSGKDICIIGSNVNEGLFINEKSIGKTIKIKNRNFEVIGVMAPEGSGLFGSGADDEVVIPYYSLRSLVDMNNWRTQKEIIVKGKAGISNQILKDELQGHMRAIRKLKPLEEENFSLNESSILAKESEGLNSVLASVGGFVGALAILVGAFGIANIMFVSVKERTNLIGVQKALGAKRAFILWQFLIEAMLLSVFGGIVGLVLVYLTTLLIQVTIDFDLVLTFSNINLGLIISSTIGLFAGIVPAYSASKLNPVEAIRSK